MITEEMFLELVRRVSELESQFSTHILKEELRDWKPRFTIAEKDKKIAELEKEVAELKSYNEWLIGAAKACGIEFIRNGIMKIPAE